MAMNHIVLVGTVDRAPERRMTPEGMAITSFKLKVVRPTRQEGTPPGTDFIPIVASRQLADRAAELRPGEVVAVEGRLVTRTIDNNGQRQKLVEVDASQLQAIASAGGEAVEVASAVGAPAPFDSLGDEPDLDTNVPF